MHASDGCWYVVKTARFREEYVTRQLTEFMGADVYFPVAKIPRSQLRKGQPHFEALFPGYVFARFDLQRHLLGFRRIRGVNSLVSFDGHPACVPGAVISELRRKERGRGYINLHVAAETLSPSCPVSVTDGPFRGYRGLFLRYSESPERVRILLDALQSPVILEVPLKAVAAGSHGSH